MNRAAFDTLADRYDRATIHYSFAHMMGRTPEFKELMESGDGIVGWIIEDFRTKKRWGMHWVLVLEKLTHERPIEPLTEDGWQKWDVDATCKAWIAWADEIAKAKAALQ